MSAMQGLVSSRSSTLPPLSSFRPTPRAHAGSALRAAATPKLSTKLRTHRLEYECGRRVQAHAEVGGAGRRGDVAEERIESLEGISSEAERRNVGSSAGASDSGMPFALYSVAPLMALADTAGYSQASYYTSLGLFLLSLPGVWSLVKRATKSKIVKKTFVVPGPTSGQGKSPKQVAGEITSFFTRSNFNVASRGDTVTFEGVMTASRGQAAFLTFCTFVSLGSAGLVLSIALPDLGEKAYYITLLSPLAGAYYWRRATRTEQIQVKIVVSDDETSSDVTVQGDDEQIDRMRRELGYMEKGMVYVKGILEQ